MVLQQLRKTGIKLRDGVRKVLIFKWYHHQTKTLTKSTQPVATNLAQCSCKWLSWQTSLPFRNSAMVWNLLVWLGSKERKLCLSVLEIYISAKVCVNINIYVELNAKLSSLLIAYFWVTRWSFQHKGTWEWGFCKTCKWAWKEKCCMTTRAMR